jgi:hypothetical protein
VFRPARWLPDFVYRKNKAGIARLIFLAYCEMLGVRFDQCPKGVYTLMIPGLEMELAFVRDKGCLQLSGVEFDAAKMANPLPASR